MDSDTRASQSANPTAKFRRDLFLVHLLVLVDATTVVVEHLELLGVVTVVVDDDDVLGDLVMVQIQ